MSDDAKKRVLLIDGHQDDRQYWADWLRTTSTEYEVVEANNGQAGLELCRRQQFDCVVLELELPGAFEVLSHVGIDRPRSAMVVLTRISAPSLLNLAEKNGAQVCLSKGRTSGPELDEAIRQALHQWN